MNDCEYSSATNLFMNENVKNPFNRESRLKRFQGLYKSCNTITDESIKSRANSQFSSLRARRERRQEKGKERRRRREKGEMKDGRRARDRQNRRWR